MISNTKAFLRSKFGKAYFTAVALVAMLVVGGSGASAAQGVADNATVEAVTGAFANVQATALAALSAIGVVAITLFAGIYAWRYGKKVFSVIAR